MTDSGTTCFVVVGDDGSGWVVGGDYMLHNMLHSGLVVGRWLSEWLFGHWLMDGSLRVYI